MSNDNDNEVELSPGFFDLNNPINDNEIAEISNLIPEKINVENLDNTNDDTNDNTNDDTNDDTNDNTNVVVEFFTLMVLNTRGKTCGCEKGGWTRKSTY